MVFAVSLAISFFAIGYRIGVRGETETISADPADNPGPAETNAARKVAVALMVWGYVMLLVASLSGQQAGESGEVAGAPSGEYQHNTAYFMQSDLFVSTGSLLYYVLTGRLGFSLLLAAPWMVQRAIYGWGRNYLLGHFFGLMAIYFIRARVAGSRLKAKQVVLIGFGVLVVLCVFPFLAAMRSLKQQLGLNASSFSGDMVRMAVRRPTRWT